MAIRAEPSRVGHLVLFCMSCDILMATGWLCRLRYSSFCDVVMAIKAAPFGPPVIRFACPVIVLWPACSGAAKHVSAIYSNKPEKGCVVVQGQSPG